MDVPTAIFSPQPQSVFGFTRTALLSRAQLPPLLSATGDDALLEVHLVGESRQIWLL